MYCDSHAHLDDRRFDADRAEIFADLERHGVGLILNIGCDLKSSLQSVALAHAYPFVYAAVGSHPDDAAQVDETRLALYRQLCTDERVRAIGEIGLDYHYEEPGREIQLPAFRRQLELAQELKLPVVVHEREAHADGMELIRQFPDVTGVFHCYSGSLEQAKELVWREHPIPFSLGHHTEEENLKFYITSFSFCLCNSACTLQSLDHVGHVVSESEDLQY